MKFWKKPLLFSLGGTAYVGLEWLWRGWSHYSMFLAGGGCFLLLGALERAQTRLSPVAKAGAGAAAITAVELLFGLIFNRSYQVWDYRDMPMNFYGQICLPFTLLWIPVSLGAMGLYRFADRQLENGFGIRA